MDSATKATLVKKYLKNKSYTQLYQIVNSQEDNDNSISKFILESMIDIEPTSKSFDKLLRFLLTKIVNKDTRISTNKELYLFHSVKTENKSLF